jgi:glycosyltransferase involved in cell wall biosynthesis
VATDCPTGPREILDDGKAGLLTPVGDATAMADAMHRLLTEPDLQKRIREGMARRYRYFTFEETGKLFDALL